MSGYNMTVGTGDPVHLKAESDGDAIRAGVDFVRTSHADDLRDQAQKVVVLMGPEGLLTRPSERIDEFVERVTVSNPAADPNVIQPGDFNIPDCNFD